MNTQLLASQPEADPAQARLVDDRGDLTPAVNRSRLQFGFVVGDVTYQAQLHSQGDRATLLIQGDIAALPFTAESPTARTAVIALVGNMKPQPWGSCGLSDKLRITVAGEIALAGPINLISLISTAIHFALQCQPTSRRVQQELRHHGA